MSAPAVDSRQADSLTTDPSTDQKVHPVCHIESPVERGLELLGDQYSLQIIDVLIQFEPQRFVELEDQINGISPRTLSARLKHLEAAGLIIRTQFATIPPKVEYSLTPSGRELAPLLSELARWTNQHFPYTPASTQSAGQTAVMA